MKNVLIAVLGLVLLLGSLWGASYVMHDNVHAWFHFPTYMTACIGIVLGVACCIKGFTELF